MYGWPLLVHFCEFCHYNTSISYSSTVWIELHTCSYCGVESVGADIAGHRAAEMNQEQHDKLAAMFAKSMTVTQQQQQQEQQHVRQQQPAVVESMAVVEEEKEPTHFISTHYTGTAHIRSDPTSEQPISHSPPPPYHEATRASPEVLATATAHGLVAHEEIMQTLQQHGIDPESLLPNQKHLFVNADYEQRSRLVELWSIAPPKYLSLENRDWQITTMEREEALARERWELQQQQQSEPQVYHEEHMFDTHLPQHSSGTQSPDEPISPIREPGEPAWPPAARMRAASIAAGHSRPETRYGEPEPYILTGYGDLSAKAVDPVYAAAAGLWQAPSYAHATMDIQNAMSMAEQYGMYEQIRNHADWERMNEQIAREKMEVGQDLGGDDCEMEL